MPSARAPRPGEARESLAATNEFARELFTDLPKRYDLLEAILSLGQNARWRRLMVDHIVPAAPARVLDVATGTAGVALQLADRTPSRVIGIDLTEAMLRRGQENVDRRGAGHRIQLVSGRAEQLPFPDEAFDGLTFTYLLRYVADPAATLTELARVLKPGSPIASLEFCVPPSLFWRAWWWLYTRAVLPTAGGLAGRAWFRVGRFLGPNISQHYRRYPLTATVALWREANLVDVDFRLMSLGGGVVMWGRKRG
ncbi:MAG: demethylmenaquinone methyltransferase / 2-methoxy-6-polyprenyl,4-benzoquinol methylase [Acidimicrobiaceae bacterium]|jgi:demethylmenaquinone methyltransferase/2-methoxy-6-polyprenyl-1,4-benzoquinol methylase|nr:demethylmenaquinone methyltransferase / 2-methoxy-6-polyprenyl,4-benzoquinol methylase [Acidimicrobiaceae bacterium]